LKFEPDAVIGQKGALCKGLEAAFYLPYGDNGMITKRKGLSRLPEALEEEKPALLILCHGGKE